MANVTKYLLVNSELCGIHTTRKIWKIHKMQLVRFLAKYLSKQINSNLKFWHTSTKIFVILTLSNLYRFLLFCIKKLFKS